MGLFSRTASDTAAEAILTYDLANSSSAETQAVRTLHELPTDAVRDAMSQLPAGTGGHNVAAAIVRQADREASTVARTEAATRAHYGR
ncbi:hypothetical protein [Streptacidiphilus anmyonensis]|uniref:hypothetical protein n=1 Tax=Streptacidiphilus anmyonensis TaxID=405782 RepID=UPI0005A8841D|nr:hypothetical protein [Streptacidiphilus anmyonensis]